MNYFEKDPLQNVHRDLAEGKTQAHFDQVLLLKGKAKGDFYAGAENYNARNFKTSKPRIQRQNPNERIQNDR